MCKINFLLQAIEDIEEAATWYAQFDLHLSERFKYQVFSAIEGLNSDIVGYYPVYRGLSRVFVKRYPYSVYFIKEPLLNTITVFSVLHERQDIQKLDTRI